MSPSALRATEAAIGVTVADARLEHHAAAADGRHVVAHRATRAVERRAEPLFRRLDLHEVVEPQTELLNSTGSCPAAVRRRWSAPCAVTRTASDTTVPVKAPQTPRQRDRATSWRRATVGLAHDQFAPHEVVAGAAHATALEPVSSRLLQPYDHLGFALAPLRDGDVHVAADDAKSVRRVVALDPELDFFPGEDGDPGREELEAFRADPDDAWRGCARRRRPATARARPAPSTSPPRHSTDTQRRGDIRTTTPGRC